MNLGEMLMYRNRTIANVEKRGRETLGGYIQVRSKSVRLPPIRTIVSVEQERTIGRGVSSMLEPSKARLPLIESFCGQYGREH